MTKSRDPIENLVARTFWAPTGLISLALLAALVALAISLAFSLDRLQPVHDYLEQLNRLEQASVKVEDELLRHPQNSIPLGREQFLQFRAAVADIVGNAPQMKPANETELKHLLTELDSPAGPTRTDLVDAITVLRRVLGSETLAQASLLEGVYRDTVSEFLLTLSVLATLVLAGLITLFKVRSRLMSPLMELTHLLSRMSEQDYREVNREVASPLMRPLFQSYNLLVNRLTALEEEHQAREGSLRDAVQAATRTLIGYQQSLARAERLAAVGEIAATLAHELRNPLAGIRLACSNIEEEANDPELAERVGTVVHEVDRLISILNSHLSRARHNPEPPKQVSLRAVITEVARLMWYQLPERMALEVNVPQDIECLIPEDGLRQVLMNLLTNAWQAMDDQAGKISISAARVGATVRLVIDDDGPGFGHELLTYGPQPFATTKPGGTGLGLSMSRRYARDLGGNLELINRVPHGAQVILEIPCHHA